MSDFKTFLERKDIRFTSKRYFNEAMTAMALGLFATLPIGLIIKTLGEQSGKVFGDNLISAFFVATGTAAMAMLGPAIGIAVANALKAPSFVLFASVVTGSLGVQFGGPAGAFIAAALGAEFGKAVSKETKVDIIITPAVTIITGGLAASLIGPAIAALMTGLGKIIIHATEMQPFFMGIIVSVIVGLVLVAPISSAALCIMLNLSGIAAGAATIGCCAQMVGFAVISFRENGVGGLVAQGLGTAKLQFPNVLKNPWILVPTTLASAIIGPISTVVFKMTNLAVGAGMGTSGFVGQIATLNSMGFHVKVFLPILLLHFVLPAMIALAADYVMKKTGLIKVGDYQLDL